MDTASFEAAVGGDRQARARLIEQLADRWFRLCVGLLGREDAARDAVQETALRFLRGLPSFTGQSRLETWAIGIAINVVREMRRNQRPPLDLAAITVTGEPADAPSLRSEQSQHLSAVVGELPDRQREAVILRFFEGLSIEETARAMDCAVGTVKATLHQALRALRRKMMDQQAAK